jgi:hypothetical protein
MSLPSANTPLYNHPLPEIEAWLEAQGCERDENDIHCWHIRKPAWRADLWMEIDSIAVCYLGAGEDGRDIQRSFKYSLTRRDLEDAIFSGP